jgi:hypothetical protein
MSTEMFLNFTKMSSEMYFNLKKISSEMYHMQPVSLAMISATKITFGATKFTIEATHIIKKHFTVHVKKKIRFR